MSHTQKKVSLFVAGLLGLASLAAVSSLSLGASNLAGLREITIRPYGDFTIDPGETLLMTAEGNYATYTVPIQTTWRLVNGSELGWLDEHCSETQSCAFHAGEQGGEARIFIEAGGHIDEQTITIRAPAAPAPFDNPFSDSLPDWAGRSIVELKHRSIVRGYEDGTYGAGDLLTRGQLLTVFYRTLLSLGMEPLDECRKEYTDVPIGHYAYEAACLFRSRGWSDALATLQPETPVSRGETASLINRVLGPDLLASKNLRLGSVLREGQRFSDVSPAHVSFGDSAVMRAMGIMKGDPGGTFGPERTLNRAEAATIFYRVMQGL